MGRPENLLEASRHKKARSPTPSRIGAGSSKKQTHAVLDESIARRAGGSCACSKTEDPRVEQARDIRWTRIIAATHRDDGRTKAGRFENLFYRPGIPACQIPATDKREDIPL